jgi:hypothetical protein
VARRHSSTSRELLNVAVRKSVKKEKDWRKRDGWKGSRRLQLRDGFLQGEMIEGEEGNVGGEPRFRKAGMMSAARWALAYQQGVGEGELRHMEEG